MTRNRKILIIVGVLVAAYFAYRWYSNRQSNNSIQGNAGSGTSLGTNLNSAAPALTDAASGDNSAPTYTSGNEEITIDLPNGQQSTGSGATGDTDQPPPKGPPPKPKPKPKPKRKPVHKPTPVSRRPRPVRG